MRGLTRIPKALQIHLKSLQISCCYFSTSFFFSEEVAPVNGQESPASIIYNIILFPPRDTPAFRNAQGPQTTLQWKPRQTRSWPGDRAEPAWVLNSAETPTNHHTPPQGSGPCTQLPLQ